MYEEWVFNIYISISNFDCLLECSALSPCQMCGPSWNVKRLCRQRVGDLKWDFIRRQFWNWCEYDKCWSVVCISDSESFKSCMIQLFCQKGHNLTIIYIYIYIFIYTGCNRRNGPDLAVKVSNFSGQYLRNH